MVHRVAALALPSVVAFDLSIAAQIFGHDDAASHYSFWVCAERPGAVATTTGFSLHADAGLGSMEQADTIVVPGFGPLEDPSPVALDALRAAAAAGTRLVSVCVGAFALAAAGLLDGRSATTHWQHADEFRDRFPSVRLNPEVLYVDEGRILTSAGITAGVDLCLHLYQRDHGAAAASAVARRMVVSMHRPGGQSQFSRRPVPDADDTLERVREWAVAEMHRPLTVAHLARRATMAPRTFARAFSEETGLSPMRWLADQRLLEAERLLEATHLTVDDIARRCGFGTAVSLRSHLARRTGFTPSAYRSSFGKT